MPETRCAAAAGLSPEQCELDVGYLDQQTFDDLHRQTRDVQNLLGGFLRYLSTSTLRGSKYPKPVRTTD